MALYKTNLLIKETRKARGMTQEQLAEGICSRETIVKFEGGSRKPHWFVLGQLMERLGLDPDVYGDEMASSTDFELLEQHQKITDLYKTYKLDEVAAEIEKIDVLMKSPDGKMWQTEYGRRMHLRLKADFYSFGVWAPERYPHLNPQLAVDCVFECIRITRPDFVIENISDYFLSEYELRLLHFLARAHVAIDANRAVEIWRAVKSNMQEGYLRSAKGNFDKHTATATYVRTLHQMSQALNNFELYEEALQLAQEGSEIAIQYHHIYEYAVFFSVKANALHGLGRIGESDEYIKKSLLFKHLFDGHYGLDFERDKKHFENYSGRKLDLTVPW